jgi:D-glycero-alpha-D-manno-heptose-7-phosphate kinase
MRNMSQFGISIRRLLERNPIKTSAPCRIDSGGTWDIKALALPFEGLDPVTLNIALNLRTFVTLLPFQSGWVKVSSDSYTTQEAYPIHEVPLSSRFGLFFAIASFFQVHGVEIVVDSSSPASAGLGGSSTAAVATIKAFSLVKYLLHQEEIEPVDILHLAYHLEDAIQGGMCGMQDQGAAVFGGVNKWIWHYSCVGRAFERESILDEVGQEELSKRILVSYSGKRHLSVRTNRVWVEKFLGGTTRSGWVEANRVVNCLASYLWERRWVEAARELRNEVAIRRDITPEAFTPVISRLIDEAEERGCGARFAGAGGGGTVWALGEIDAIERLRETWTRILKSTKNGRILGSEVDPIGVRAER